MLVDYLVEKMVLMKADVKVVHLAVLRVVMMVVRLAEN